MNYVFRTARSFGGPLLRSAQDRAKMLSLQGLSCFIAQHSQAVIQATAWRGSGGSPPQHKHAAPLRS